MPNILSLIEGELDSLDEYAPEVICNSIRELIRQRFDRLHFSSNILASDQSIIDTLNLGYQCNDPDAEEYIHKLVNEIALYRGISPEDVACNTR